VKSTARMQIQEATLTVGWTGAARQTEETRRGGCWNPDCGIYGTRCWNNPVSTPHPNIQHT